MFVSRVASILGPAITRYSLETTLAFNNKLILVELSVGQLVAALENSVSQYPVHDGRFAQLAGLRIEVNTTRSAMAGRPFTETPGRLKTVILESRTQGELETLLVEDYQLMDVNRTFVVATNSFLGSGGDEYSSLANGNLLVETGIGEQQILEDYIQDAIASLVVMPNPPPRPSRIVLYE